MNAISIILLALVVVAVILVARLLHRGGGRKNCGGDRGCHGCTKCDR